MNFAATDSPNQALDERVKAGYRPAGLLHAREMTWEALKRISASIRPGQLESEATENAQAILRELGSPTFWHRTYVRFGVNTLCTFYDQSQPEVRLGENDIYFIDLGPVWNDPGEDGVQYEGDAGVSGFVGGDHEHQRACTAVREIFQASREEWKKGNRSGKDLYDWIARETERRGWVLQLKADGHRVSDFPHRLYCKRGIGELTYKPSPDIWILEVQIRHPTREFGAFYEDLLT